MVPAVSEGTQVNQTVVQLIKGDVTDLDVQAFVYYAQHDLALGSGFGTAIAGRGGPKIQEALSALAPLETGQAVVTDAGKMKQDFIIHAVGPRFQEDETEAKLRTTMQATLACAEEKGVKRLAFPAMGAGYYGIPYPLCAKVMTEELAQHLAGDTTLTEVIICVLDSPMLSAFEGPVAAMST